MENPTQEWDEALREEAGEIVESGFTREALGES